MHLQENTFMDLDIVVKVTQHLKVLCPKVKEEMYLQVNTLFDL